MLYNAYEVQRRWLAGASHLANLSSDWLSSSANPMSYLGMSGIVAASLDVFAHAASPRGKPEFGLDKVTVDGRELVVREEIVDRMPFGQLKHFVRESAPEGQPRLLIVAPMSGHFATLLRGTVERMLPSHEVFITDWRDAKLVPLEEGTFDLDDYVDTLINWLGKIGPGAHMLAVCQPSVPAFAATALMNADNHPCAPKTLSLMGGPIDTRQAPTSVNTLATERPHAWFQQNVICTVPAIHPGSGRKVYPGFLQLAGFMTMNLGSHLVSHFEMFKHLVDGDEEGADATRDFYDEYRSVCDMTAEFYLQTIDVVFQRHLLPKGEMMHRGRLVDPSAITRTALLAIEGERDDISGVGQTRAVLTLADKLPATMKKYHLAKGAGHYGIFNGRKWREKIAPVLERFIAEHD